MISGSVICDHGSFSEVMAKIFGTKVMQILYVMTPLSKESKDLH